MKYFGLRKPFTEIRRVTHDGMEVIHVEGPNISIVAACSPRRTPEVVSLFATRQPIFEKADWLVASLAPYDGTHVIREDGELLTTQEIDSDDE